MSINMTRSAPSEKPNDSSPTEMGSVFNVVNLSVINNTVDGSDVRKEAWIFWGNVVTSESVSWFAV
ncbi:hypothetical protein T4D_14537, partial [Trichinella pseudospiralis]